MYRKLLAIVIALYLVPSQAQNSTPDAARITNFQTDTVVTNADSNASLITDSCPKASGDTVYERHKQAVARRKCLEIAQVFFATTAAAAPSPSADPNVRLQDAATKRAASTQLVKVMKEAEEAEKRGAANADDANRDAAEGDTNQA